MMDLVATERGQTWALKTRVSNRRFERYDFTGTDFNQAIFERTTFVECLFDQAVLTGAKLFYESAVERCLFRHVDLRGTTFGSSRGPYTHCRFEHCNFNGRHFEATRFDDCVFDRCRLKGVNFNASSFARCRFIGPLTDVTFNGLYDTNAGRLPVLVAVDFAAAAFGEFVSFVDCDLTTCQPPRGQRFADLLYQLYQDDARVLSTGSKDRLVLPRR